MHSEPFNGREVVRDDAGRPLWGMLPSWTYIHAVRSLEDPSDPDWTGGRGRTVCGYRGWLELPGVLTRLRTPRCNRCCDALGLPRGLGHPKNDDECRRILGYPRPTAQPILQTPITDDFT